LIAVYQLKEMSIYYQNILNKMKNLIIIIIFSLAFNNATRAQGCVAVRSTGNTCSMQHPDTLSKWQLNLNNRYFRSYKHFVGKEEQHHRVDSGTEVINYSYSLDITLSRKISSRWSLAITAPVISNVRSSLYEHYGNSSKNPNARRETKSFGLGDVRVSAYRWMFDAEKSKKGNLQAGLGIKLPTGDFRYQDMFWRNDSTYMIAPVDQSIQLGDGGTGIAVELRGYYNISKHLGTYADLYYLINPREQNGVSTARGGTPNANAVKYFTSTMSVPDQYLARAGAQYMINNFTVAGGLRLEGIPSSDLVGGDKGFRRPGYILSVEPVLSYQLKKVQLYASVPFAVERNRTQSNADKLITKATGNKAHGDAAFANYFVNVGATFKF
jgi:hypothetical protein